MSLNHKVCLGAIVGVHGIKGEVKVKSFTQTANSIDKYGTLSNADGSKEFKLKILGKSKDILRAEVEGITDRNAAESLIGTELYVAREKLPEPKEEEYYHSDLIGLEARKDGKKIGVVSGVFNFGAGDLLEVKTEAESEMIPFNKSFVPEVNIKDGYIIVNYTMVEANEN